MKITVFSSNQRRHTSLINRLASVSDTVHAVVETSTLFPGQVESFYRKSPVMQEYFSKVIESEERIFPESRFLSGNVCVLPSSFGDLNKLTKTDLKAALESDIYIVFGSSFIKGWLVDFLIENRAVNIHMGLSPYYRGTACNFWAIHDRRPSFVGATVHLLSKGLDSGPILFHSRPTYKGESSFEFTMKAVDQVQHDLVGTVKNSTLLTYRARPQDSAQELRCSKNSEFTDEVAAKFMKHEPSPSELANLLKLGTKPDLVLQEDNRVVTSNRTDFV